MRHYRIAETLLWATAAHGCCSACVMSSLMDIYIHWDTGGREMIFIKPPAYGCICFAVSVTSVREKGGLGYELIKLNSSVVWFLDDSITG